MQPKIKTAHTKCPGCATEFVTGIDVSDVVTSELQEAREKLAAAASKPSEVKQYPSWFPRKACAGKGCSEEHPNDNYSQKPSKRCDNDSCVGKGQLLPASAQRCPWCQSKDDDGDDIDEDMRFEALDEDDLKRIPAPTAGGHNHAH